MHSAGLLQDIGLSILFAALASHTARLLRQPLILGYVAAGILLGAPMGLGLVTDEATIELIAEIGLLLLLFIIGLEIRLPDLLRLGRPVFGVGLGQFFGCLFFGLAVFRWILPAAAGGPFDLLYLSLATALSSTLIVVKLLSDKFESHTTAGQLTIGVLVIQDLCAIVFMAFQPNLNNPEVLGLARSLVLGAVLVGGAFAVSRYGLSRLFAKISRIPELVLISALAWCFGLCGAAQAVGLSKEMGALVAGLSLAAFPHGADITAKLIGVRDFFVTLFFVALGLKMPRPTFEAVGMSFAVLGVVMAGRLLTVIPTAALTGQGLRIGALTAVNLAQISEFSIVIVALGAGFGHVSPALESLVLTSTLLGSIVATYLILYNHPLAAGVVHTLHRLGIQKRQAHSPEGAERQKRDIAVLGCFREGRRLVDLIHESLPDLKSRVAVVDYNVKLQTELKERGFHYVYADLAQPHSLVHCGLEETSLIICTLSDTFLKGTTNRKLLLQLRPLAPRACLVMTADDKAQAEDLRRNGADAVLNLSEVGAKGFFEILTQRMSQT